MRSGVRERSTKAVAAAGTRERGSAVKTAGHWQGKRDTPLMGKHEGPWRPGKTRDKRRR